MHIQKNQVLKRLQLTKIHNLKLQFKAKTDNIIST